MPNLSSRLARWANLVRLDEWFTITFMPLLVPFYYLLLVSGKPYPEAIWDVGLVLVFGFMCASFAFVINTLFDREQDRRAGKEYALTAWPTTRIVALLVGLLALSAVVLVAYIARLRLTTGNGLGGELDRVFLTVLSREILSVSRSGAITFDLEAARPLLGPTPYCERGLVLGLMALAYFFAVVYSTPPLRLKERGILGPLTIAVSHFCLPPLLVFAVFDYLYWETLLVSSLFLLTGLRMMLLHQLLDYGNDLAAGVSTFTTMHGFERVSLLINKVIMPLEIGVLFLALLYTNVKVPGTLLYGGLCLALFYLHDRLQRRSGTALFPIQHTATVDFYLLFWPVFLLLIGILSSWVFFLFLAFHLVIGRPYWVPYWNYLLRVTKQMLHRYRPFGE